MVHVWKCTDKYWSKHEVPQSPSGRYGHRAVVWRNKMIIFGGYNGKERLNDTYEYDLDRREWRVVVPEQDAAVPSPRDCHSAVLYKDRYFVIHGGGDGFRWLQDTWQYDLLTSTWQEIKVENSECSLVPSGRAGHSAVACGEKMILFGGWNGRRTLNDLYEFNFQTKSWTSIPHQGDAPQARDSHTATLYKDQMIIIGGGDGKVRLNDIFVFDIKKRFWRKFNTLGEVNAGRAGHVTCLLNDMLYMYAGGDGSRWLQEVYQCDLKAKKWTMIEAAGENAPGSYGLSAVVYKNKIVCYGGGNGRDWFQSIYEFEADDKQSIKYMKNNLSKVLYSQKFGDLKIVHKTEDDDMLNDDMICEKLEQTLDISKNSESFLSSTSTSVARVTDL